MRLMRSACIALSMYTRLPVPQFSWEEEDMQYAFCFFPLAGVLTGALLIGEKMTVRETVGCVLMFFAVILAQLSPVISSIRRNGRSHR